MMANKLAAVLLVLSCVACSGRLASGQDASANTERSFQQVFDEWKYVLRDLRNLQQEFGVANEGDLKTIRERYQAKLDEARTLISELRVAGLASYEKSPNTDRELTRFLVKLAQDDAKHDRFERAFQTAQTLIKHRCDDKSLYDIAGTAAVCTHRFELAKKHLTEADSLGVLKSGSDYLPVIEELQANWEEEQKIREAEADDNLPRVKLQTNKGDIVVELFENEAPDTVGNFIYLVEKGYYDGLTFHRVLPGFMAQGGCNKGDGTGGPGYKIYCECLKGNYRRHFAGSLSMAKGRLPNTGGSQFFLNFAPTSYLDGAHTVFGRVVEGMDVLPKLQRRNPEKSEDLSIVPDRIIKAEVLRKRPDREYLPNKAPAS